MAIFSMTNKQAAVSPPGAEAIARRTVHSARSRLRGSGYPELRRLRCSFHEGVLTISGSVSSYYMKQVAHALLKDIVRVEIYSDQIKVVPPPIRSDMQEKQF